jgi:hypothetical protein
MWKYPTSISKHKRFFFLNEFEKKDEIFFRNSSWISQVILEKLNQKSDITVDADDTDCFDA